MRDLAFLLLLIVTPFWAQAERPPKQVCQRWIQRHHGNNADASLMDVCLARVNQKRSERRQRIQRMCFQYGENIETQCFQPRREVITELSALHQLLIETKDDLRSIDDKIAQAIIDIEVAQQDENTPADGLTDLATKYSRLETEYAKKLFDYNKLVKANDEINAQMRELAQQCESVVVAYGNHCTPEDEVVVTPLNNQAIAGDDAIIDIPSAQSIIDRASQSSEVVVRGEMQATQSVRTAETETQNKLQATQTLLDTYLGMINQRTGGHDNEGECVGTGLAANCNAGGSDNNDRTAGGSGGSPTTPSGDGGIYAEIPRDGDGYGGDGNENPDNSSNQNPHSPHGELSKTGGGGGSGFSFDPSALNTGIGSASANIGVNSRGSNYYSGNTFPTQNNSNSRSRYTASYNSGSFNAQTGSNFGQGSSARNSQASKNQGDSASTGAGWAGHTGNMALNSGGGNGNLNLGNDNNNSDYKKARTNQGSKSVAQRSGNKQFYSSKNAHSGGGSGIFSSSKDRNLRRGPASVKTGANAQSGSQFDPSKYEPSLAAQQRAMARATGRMISGQSRGHVVWPKDIHRHKKGSKTSVFNYVRRPYKKHLVD